MSESSPTSSCNAEVPVKKIGKSRPSSILFLRYNRSDKELFEIDTLTFLLYNWSKTDERSFLILRL